MKTLNKFTLVTILLVIMGISMIFQSSCKKQVGLDDTIGSDDTSIYPEVPPPAYWPTVGWQSTTLEAQGMDSGRAADLVAYIQSRGLPIRSVQVVRNGYLVLEAYFHPFHRDLWHVIHSCTKSVVSTLVGIAVGRGEIPDENVYVLDYFSNYTVANNDEQKQAMQLKHLLTMSTGMNARDSYLYQWEGLSAMRNSSNWTQYALDLPMIHDPGTTFDYSNCSSYLIASLLSQAVGQNGLDYANEHLFSNLGISAADVYWPRSPQGVVYGWGEIRMKPTDMARFGFLFLHRGMWDANRLLPETWVNKATRTQMNAGTLSEGYGYQWWVDNDEYFMALGYGGQYIIINPALNLVVTFSSALRDNDFGVPQSLYHDYILDAVLSTNAVTDDPQKQARLNSLLEAVSNPPAQPVPAAPVTADDVSGKLFYFDANQDDYHYIGLTFTPGADQAQLKFSYRDRNLDLPLGLDDRYRTTFQHLYYRGYKGRWENENTFLIHYQIVDHTEWGIIRLTFSGNTVSVSLQDQRYDEVTNLTARLQ